MSSPKFNNPKSAKLWQELVEDLLLSSDKSKSTDIETLKQRYGKLEVTLNVAPATLLSSDFRKMATALDGKYKDLLKDLQEIKDPSKSEKFRKAFRKELDAFETDLLKSVQQSQTRMSRALLRDAERTERRNTKEFIQQSAKNSKEIAETLAKQLMEVSDQRGLSPESSGLKRLEADLAAALKAIRHEDYIRYKSLSENLSDLKKYNVNSSTRSKLDEIKDYVRRDSERRAERSEVWNRRVDSLARHVGLGGVVRTTRTVGRGTATVYRAGRSVFNAAYRAGGSVSSAVLNRRIQSSASKEDREATEDREDQILLKRQVRALEGIESASKKAATHAGGGGLASGASTGRLGKLMALLGKYGLVGMAGMAGWAVGSWIYDKFSEEIQDGIEVVVGVVQKTIEWVNKGVDWFTDFLKNPLKYVESLGSTLKEAWDNSVFAKMWNNPAGVMKDVASTVVTKLGALKDYASSAANTATSAATAAWTATGNAVSSTYNSLKEATSKLFSTSGPNVNMSGLNPGVKDNFVGMLSEYRAKGGGVTNVDSAYRSTEEQARLYAKDPTRAAPPGRSSHEKGLAIDISRGDANKMASMGLLSKYGFSRPVSGEPWHIQASGTSSALASAGIYSADFPKDQQGTANSTPVPMTLSTTDVSFDGSGAPSALTSPISIGGQGASPTLYGDTTKGSVTNIPTFSYVDTGFFLMNVGVFSGA